MARRINTKLIALLLGGLFVVTVVAVTAAYFALNRGPEFYIARADKAKDAGDWVIAEREYSKAVGADPGNMEAINLWLESMDYVHPKDRLGAINRSRKQQVVLRKRTEIRRTEARYHIEWLEYLYDLAQAASSYHRVLSDDANRMLDSVPESDPQWVHGRRYRGMADSARLSEVGSDQEKRKQIREDLEAALAFDEADAHAAAALSNWYLNETGILVKRGLVEDGDDLLNEGLTFTRTFSEEHPDDPLPTMTLALYELSMVLRAGVGDLNEALDGVRPILAESERRALASPDVPVFVMLRLAEQVSRLDRPNDGLNRAVALIAHGLEVHPGDPELMFQHARRLRLAGHHDDAIAAYNTLINHEPLPIGVKSVNLFERHATAIRGQFDIEADRWAQADPADHDASENAEKAARSRFEQFKKATTTNDPEIAYMEGRLAMAEGNPTLAASKLADFLERASTRLDRERKVQVLYLMSQALVQLRQEGSAYQRLQEANDIARGQSVPVLQQLVMIELDRRRMENANDLIRQLEQLAPEDERVISLRGQYRSMSGQTTSGESDPIAESLSEFAKAITEGRLDDATTALESALATHPDNTTLLWYLARLKIDLGLNDEALKYVKQGRAAHPDDDTFKVLEAQLGGGDLATVLEQIVDGRAGLTDMDRLLAKWQIFLAQGLADEAAAFFESAKDLEPLNPIILEEHFIRAIEAARQDDRAEDWARAREITILAGETNADQAEGFTFRGRLELARGDFSAAIASLTQATDMKEYDSTVWRYLAVAHRDAGNYTQAKSAFQESLKRNATNPITLREYADLQLQMRNTAGAIKTVREALRFAPNDGRLLGAYLSLEGRFGNRKKAIDARTRMFENARGDIANALELVGLLILEARPDEAWTVLETLNVQEDTDRLLVMDAKARWHAQQGDLESAGRVFRTLIDTNPSNELLTQAYIRYGRFLTETGSSEEAMTAYRAARRFQDDTRREADRALVMFHTSRGEYREAVAAVETSLQGDPNDARLLLQLIDLSLQLGLRAMEADDTTDANQWFAKAEEGLAKHDQKYGATEETALMTGALAFGRGDLQKAGTTFNSAVLRYPRSHQALMRRIRLNLYLTIQQGERGLKQRILGDVTQAMQLRPTRIDPLLLLIEMYASQKDPETGAPQPDYERIEEVYRQILSIQPRTNEVRLALVQLLMSQRRFDQAALLVRDAITLTPESADWHETLGDIQSARGRAPVDYVEHYREAVSLSATPARLIKTADALLTMRPARPDQVLPLLNQHRDLVDLDLTLQMREARALRASNRIEEATNLMATVFDKARTLQGTTPEETASLQDVILRLWFGQAQLMMPARDMADLVAGRVSGEPDLLLDHLVGRTLFSGSADPGLQAQGLDQLERVRQRLTADPAALPEMQQKVLQRDTGWFLGLSYYGRADYANAADAWQWALEAIPNDLECNNNLAFVLAKYLDDASGAMEPATRAYTIAPKEPSIMDTYGYVLLENGNHSEAERVFRASLDIESRAGTWLHLAQAHLAQNEKVEAVDALRSGREVAERDRQSDTLKEINEMLARLTTEEGGG